LGAYRRGSDPQVDESIHYYPLLEEFMDQRKEDHTDLANCYRMLAEILGMEHGQGDGPNQGGAAAGVQSVAPAAAPKPTPAAAFQVPNLELKPLKPAQPPPNAITGANGTLPQPQFGSAPTAPQGSAAAPQPAASQ